MTGGTNPDGTSTGSPESAEYFAFGGQTVDGLAVRITKLVSTGYCVGLVVETSSANVPDPPAALESVSVPSGWQLSSAKIHGPASDCLVDESESWVDALEASGAIGWEGEWGCTLDADVTLQFPESTEWDTNVDFAAVDLEVERDESLMPCPE